MSRDTYDEWGEIKPITGSTPGAIYVPETSKRDGYWRLPNDEEIAVSNYQREFNSLPANVKAAINAGTLQISPKYATVGPGNDRRTVDSGIEFLYAPAGGNAYYKYDTTGRYLGQDQFSSGGGGFLGNILDKIGGGIGDFISDPAKATTKFFENPGVKEAALVAAAVLAGPEVLAAMAPEAAAATGTLGAAEGALTVGEIAALPGAATAGTAGTVAGLETLGGAGTAAGAAPSILTAGSVPGSALAATTAAGEAAGLGSLAAGVGGNAAALTNAGMSGAAPEGLASLGSTVTPGIVEAAAPTAVNAGATSVNQMIAAGTAPGSVGAAGAASGALSGTELAAAQGLVTVGATPALVTAAEQGAQNYIDSGGAALSGQGGGPNGTNIFTQQSVNEGVASGLSPGSMGADMASRGALTPAQLGAASGVVTSGSGIPDLSKVKDLLPKSTTSTTSTGTNNAGLLALLALLASQNKGGTDDSYQGTIPEYTFSRTQNEIPKGQRPGQGGIDYFSPATYTKKAANGGLMSIFEVNRY